MQKETSRGDLVCPKLNECIFFEHQSEQLTIIYV